MQPRNGVISPRTQLRKRTPTAAARNGENCPHSGPGTEPCYRLNHPARSVTLLLVLTGRRVGELLALRWGSVDLNARMLRVCETVYDGHFDQPKTKRSARPIPIGTETAEIFAAIRPAVVDARALVFATREGLPLERWNLLRKHLKPAAKKLGLSGVTWHLLRHSHATMLDSVGTPIGTMQSLLGHSTPEITREIYLHAIPEEQRRAVESVERLVFGPKWTQFRLRRNRHQQD